MSWKSQCAANKHSFIKSGVGEKLISEEAFPDLLWAYLITTCNGFERMYGYLHAAVAL